MITPRVMADSAKTHIATYKVETLAAGADLADIPMFRCPKNCIIKEVGVIGEATASGIGEGNASVFLVEVGATAIATKTYDDEVPFPAKGAYDSLGAISNAKRAEGDIVTLSITNGDTADVPVLTVQVEYVINENL